MKSREGLVRLKLFQFNEKQRQVMQLDMMIAEFNKMSSDLEGQIGYEEKKAGISDQNHFAYPTFAKAARQRQENLAVSQKDLKIQREEAAAALLEAQEELKKAQMLEGRDSKSKQHPVPSTPKPAAFG
jgi:flagellar export protein FliJ